MSDQLNQTDLTSASPPVSQKYLSNKSLYLIFSDRFSDNLGDGLIAECLETALSEVSSKHLFRATDLNLRDYYISSPEDRGIFKQITSSFKRKFKRFCPENIQEFVEELKVRFILRSKYRKILGKCCGIIIGGGNLISGTSLYFPIRLCILVDMCEELSIPIVIYGVGVTSPNVWTKRGSHYLLRAFRGRTLQYVAVRDTASADVWMSTFGGARPGIVADPALLTAMQPRVTKENKRANRAVLHRKRIGIGLMSSDVVRASKINPSQSPPTSIEFYHAVALELIFLNFRPVFFTNGELRDVILLEELREKVEASCSQNSHFEFVTRPNSPNQLVQTIATLDCIIAHRMHANIIAFTQGVPHVGLAWELKVNSFFAATERENFLITSGDVSPKEVALAAQLAMSTGLDLSRLLNIQSRARTEIINLSSKLEIYP